MTRREVPREGFDREVRWPDPRPELEREPVHPDRIPDDTPGPFRRALDELEADSEGGETE